MTGYVSSFQSLGTLDGPGIRYTVFMQGCNLRCACCHNPETWRMDGGTPYTAEELFRRIRRYRSYFGDMGGVTLSGGEPLLQAAFVRELFMRCKNDGIHTCLDTSGSVINEEVVSLLPFLDYVLLDIKYTNDGDYQRYVGCSYDTPLAFLSFLDQHRIPTRLRSVIVPGVNDTEAHVTVLKTLADRHRCVDRVELLPFRKLCHTKYEKLGISFRFSEHDEPTAEKMNELNQLLQ